MLRPEATVANHTPFELQVVEVFTGDDLDKEKKWEGKVLVEEKREKTTTLAPSEIGVLTQKEVYRYLILVTKLMLLTIHCNVPIDSHAYIVKGCQVHEVKLCQTYRHDKYTYRFFSLNSSMWGLLHSPN